MALKFNEVMAIVQAQVKLIRQLIDEVDKERIIQTHQHMRVGRSDRQDMSASCPLWHAWSWGLRGNRNLKRIFFPAQQVN